MTTQTLTRQEAAEARSHRHGGTAGCDRRGPGQRRSSTGERNRVNARLVRSDVSGLEVAEGPLSFLGMASVTGQAYEMYDMFGPYDEEIHLGAFAESLARTDLDVPFVLGHDSMRRIARTGNDVSPLFLKEITEGDVTGLEVRAPDLQRDDADVSYITPKLKSRLIDEMSFMFRVTSGRWSDDWMTYHIHAVDIHRGDVAIVGYGANPYTAGSGLRAAPELPALPIQAGVPAGRDADVLRTLIDI